MDGILKHLPKGGDTFERKKLTRSKEFQEVMEIFDERDKIFLSKLKLGVDNFEDRVVPGHLFNRKELENCIMTPVEHEQAKQGDCPSCSGNLKSLSKNQDMTIKHCEPCNKFYII